MRLRHVVLTLGIALLSASSLPAQETTGRIEGRIVDAQSLPVPGATVTATGPQGEKTAITDTDGRFTLPLLTPGAYQLRAELQGFKVVQRNDINVSLGQTVDFGLQLEVGELSETVIVAGVAPVVDPRSTTTGGVIDSDFVRSRAHRAANQRRQLHGAGRGQLRIRRTAEPVDCRRQRTGQSICRRWREHHQSGVRRARLVLDRLRLAR